MKKSIFVLFLLLAFITVSLISCTPAKEEDKTPQPTEATEPTDEPVDNGEPTDEPVDNGEPTDEPVDNGEPTDEPVDNGDTGGENNDFIALANEMVDFMVKEEFSEVEKHFDSNMKNSFPEEAFKQFWTENILATAGNFEEKLSEKTEEVVDSGETLNIVAIRCKFEKSEIQIKTVFNPGKEIVGLFFDYVASEEDVKVLKSLANEMVDAMGKDDFEGATKDFDDNFKELMPADALKKVWEDDIIGNMGPYKGRDDDGRHEQVTEEGKVFECIFVKCEFEKGFLYTQVTFDKEKKVVGLYFRPEDFFEKMGK